MRILVTGGAGFIGSAIVRRLLTTGHEITVLDDLSSGREENLPEGCTLVVGSITDKAIVRKTMEGKDAAVHLAAMVSVPETIAKPAEAERVNALGTVNVLQAALEAKAKKVVLASSAAVYGLSPTTPTKETERPSPLSPYAITKLAMEDYAAFYTKQGLPCLCLRFFNVYGPRQQSDSQYAAAIPIFIDRARRGETITIHGDGKQTRDFIYVEDVARAIELGLTSGTGVVNIATGKSVTIQGLAETIVRLTNSKSRLAYGEARAGDPRTSLADVTRAREELGFEAATPLEEGLKKTIETFKII